MTDETTAALIAAGALSKELAGLAGELKGRDFTREHMEARQDAEKGK